MELSPFKICMRWCFNDIFLFLVKCSLTAPQLIRDDWREKLSGRVMFAIMLNVQDSVMKLLFMGHFSVTSRDLSNSNKKCSNRKFPVGYEEPLTESDILHDLPII